MTYPLTEDAYGRGRAGRSNNRDKTRKLRLSSVHVCEWRRGYYYMNNFEVIM